MFDGYYRYAAFAGTDVIIALTSNQNNTRVHHRRSVFQAKHILHEIHCTRNASANV